MVIRKGIYGGVDADDLMGAAARSTPTTFARTSLDVTMKAVAEVAHTCRHSSKISAGGPWNRRVRHEIDKNKVVTHDPLG